jgi:hypothetical protein
LYGPVAHAIQGHRSAGQREASGEINLSNHSVPPGTVVIICNW